MSIVVTPHLNFRGDARRALEFYQAVFGGELTIITYGEMAADPTMDDAELVVWGQIASNAGFRVMAHDVYPHLPWDQGHNPFFVSVRGTDEAELRRYWDGLAGGAVVAQPYGPSAWSPAYGQLTDRFGVTWVLDITVE